MREVVARDVVVTVVQGEVFLDETNLFPIESVDCAELNAHVVEDYNIRAFTLVERFALHEAQHIIAMAAEPRKDVFALSDVNYLPVVEQEVNPRRSQNFRKVRKVLHCD